MNVKARAVSTIIVGLIAAILAATVLIVYYNVFSRYTARLVQRGVGPTATLTPGACIVRLPKSWYLYYTVVEVLTPGGIDTTSYPGCAYGCNYTFEPVFSRTLVLPPRQSIIYIYYNGDVYILVCG